MKMPAVGTMVGTPVAAAIHHFVEKYGRSAGQELVLRMNEKWRGWLDPHGESLGLLGAKKYPLAFVGDIVRHAAIVARAPDEDAFVREIAVAGIDASVGTVARIILRYGATPQSLAERGQETWNMFFDTGRVSVVVGKKEYVATVTDWTSHDGYVCRIAMEVRRRLIERTGHKSVEARREKCISFGHDMCVVRLKW